MGYSRSMIKEIETAIKSYKNSLVLPSAKGGGMYIYTDMAIINIER
jgi:hypothetical protein